MFYDYLSRHSQPVFLDNSIDNTLMSEINLNTPELSEQLAIIVITLMCQYCFYSVIL